MKVDGVFSGGGVKAFALLGALKVVEHKGFEFERLAGTSAGAIIAAFIAAGYEVDEVIEMFYEFDLTKFLDESTIDKTLPFVKWLLVYFRLGLYRGDQLEKWIEEKLAAKGIHKFSDFPTPDKLKVIASDLSIGRMVVFPDDLQHFYQLDPNQFSVAKAVRISASIPYFFIPVKLRRSKNEKSILVDGGLLSNFPVWVFKLGDGRDERPVLGLKLSESVEGLPIVNINSAFDMFRALMTTMMKAHDMKYVSKVASDQTMFIPVKGIDATDFHIKKEAKQQLIQVGKERAEEFFAQKWMLK
ncbi:patatin-like phospholipase family protein [Salirhabdus salicampi]|uniref:patatin-like phospholipase family protein n=1 Tax=Salirhabdus salicampi TaxID=476102 RepID=UPI0020C525D6|nr:patatin-like phospholipase family protein [Salirhabdus salicampi]MCP8616834.1 patatin-like phospholipase family protein [Salirhabdus salicampi]